MKLSDVFPSRYFAAADFSSPRALKILDLTLERLGAEEKQKPILWFVGEKKGLVLNKTNFGAVATIAGSEETDDWTGIKVELFADETFFKGELRPCLRVRRPRSPQVAAAPAGGRDEDDIPDSFEDEPMRTKRRA